MSSSTSSETQLLAEHFGYPPVSLLDDIINSINILAEQALNSVERGLLAAKPASLGFRAPPPPSKKTKHNATTTAAAEDAPQPSPEEAQRHEVENGTHQLETLLCASIDRNFDIFEIWVMRNILTVRPDDRDWIRLSHYEGLDFSAASKRRKAAGTEPGHDGAMDTEGAEGEKEPTNQPGAGGEDGNPDAAETGSDAPTLASVARLRRRLQASQKLNVMLHAERARNAKLLEELREFLHGASGPAAVKVETGESQNQTNLAFLRSKGDLTVGDAETPLTTTTAFSLSQLQALRALSTSLRTMMPDLVQSTSGADQSDTKKSWRTERLEYVEGSTRRHLENVRGLELGASGYVRDGEWQGEGRSLAKGEVEGLERIAGVLGAKPNNGVRKPETGTADAMDES
ncbi:hypothetical protein MCOR25_002762 [Pyricularia grisea]|uniref:Mis12 domain-containing protein n=1 Tax=Pyricularia grisea TaxID=148305 RepID=A0A6P8AR99_PYRGI|nr:uncharacterized protein PgNI_09942 [Pyricularia grisea]KAI6376552.1 hypothetical protein MCOR25_002762 [Pyricularia grisea]TLD04627.1 hypothetical protein PgNI_09942 [Pyricularia grisea]